MSGRSRNIIHEGKIAMPFSRHLPEIIRESPVNSPGYNFGDEITSEVTETKKFKSRFQYNSTASSAQSQRFHDMFYKTDWPSLSDTGTDSPDCIELEGSDSSASSMFSWADAEGTKMVAEEWEKIQRTLYSEPGPKVTQKHLIEECNQWKTIYPHLRIVGRGFGSSLDIEDAYDTEEEVLALHYDSDVDVKEVLTAPLVIDGKTSQDFKCQRLIPIRIKKKLAKEEATNGMSASTTRSKSGTTSLVEQLDSFLHITPIAQSILHNNNYSFRNQSSAIIKSEMSSSRWRHRNISPDFVSLPHQNILPNKIQTRDNSAASLFSHIEAIKYSHCNQNTLNNDILRNKSSYKRQSSSKKSKQNALDKHSYILEPLEPILPVRTFTNRSVSISHGMDPIRSASQKNRNVSLPPILSDDTSRRKQYQDISTFSGKSSRRNNKTTLTPIELVASSQLPKHNIGADIDSLGVFNERSVTSKKNINKKRNSKKKVPSK